MLQWLKQRNPIHYHVLKYPESTCLHDLNKFLVLITSLWERIEIGVQALKQLLNLLDHRQVAQRLHSQVCAMGHVMNLHQVRSSLVLQLLAYTMSPALKHRDSIIPERDHLLGDLVIIKPTVVSQGRHDHVFKVVSIPFFCHTPKKQKM
jgi:hypothetical protein